MEKRIPDRWPSTIFTEPEIVKATWHLVRWNTVLCLAVAVIPSADPSLDRSGSLNFSPAGYCIFIENTAVRANVKG